MAQMKMHIGGRERVLMFNWYALTTYEKTLFDLVRDWTDENEVIAAELARHGRQSVPLYVYYPPGPSSRPVLLPEILTQKIVTDTLKSGNGTLP